MRPPAKCGTISGYQRHLRLGEAVCPPCRSAIRTYSRSYFRDRCHSDPSFRKAHNDKTSRQSKALWELARRHRYEFQDILAGALV